MLCIHCFLIKRKKLFERPNTLPRRLKANFCRASDTRGLPKRTKISRSSNMCAFPVLLQHHAASSLLNQKNDRMKLSPTGLLR